MSDRRETYSFEEASRNLELVLSRAVISRKEVIVERPGRESVAILPVAELDSMQESLHLLQSPRNASRLFTALNRARTQSLPVQTLDELTQELGLEDLE